MEGKGGRKWRGVGRTGVAVGEKERQGGGGGGTRLMWRAEDNSQEKAHVTILYTHTAPRHISLGIPLGITSSKGSFSMYRSASW